VKDDFDLVVIGAGIVGASCAWQCARAGMRTAVIERDVIGGGATAAGMGHIVVMDDSPAQFALTRYSQVLWRELACALPGYVEYEERGTLWVAADEEEMQEVWRKHALYGEQDVPTEVLDAQQLAAAEPALRNGLAGGLRVVNDAVLYAPGAARFLLEKALNLGAILYRGQVEHLGSGQALLLGGRELHAPLLINAAGEWASILTPNLPVKRRKGHLAITDRYAGKVRHQVVELGYLKSAHFTTSDSVAFNVQPRSTGQILIGSSRQYGAEDSAVDAAMLSRMLGRALEYMPELAFTSVVRTWTGFRAATPDKLPLIGACAHDPTLLLATGHEGLGITTSLATGRLLADLVQGRESEIPLEPYLPERASLVVQHA
jgi:D-hydroxyproline dehydrogenase subunit beta